jgi:hypothetical protein
MAKNSQAQQMPDFTGSDPLLKVLETASNPLNMKSEGFGGLFLGLAYSILYAVVGALIANSQGKNSLVGAGIGIAVLAVTSRLAQNRKKKLQQEFRSQRSA